MQRLVFNHIPIMFHLLSGDVAIVWAVLHQKVYHLLQTCVTRLNANIRIAEELKILQIQEWRC